MPDSAHRLIPDSFHPVPSLATTTEVRRAPEAPPDSAAVGYPVAPDGALPDRLGLDWPTLRTHGFDGKPGQAFYSPRLDEPGVVIVGIGGEEERTTALLRDAVAAFVRAVPRGGRLAFEVGDHFPLPAAELGATVAEGAVLARYAYTALQSKPEHTPLESFTLVTSADDGAVTDGIRRGLIAARAATVARDLTNAPPGHLTAARFAELAEELGPRFGFDVAVHDKAALIEQGIGGLLGVNSGSVEEPRMIVLHYAPPEGAAAAHVALVGKGIMYDSGGISLKPSDPMHLLMKMDMGGAAAVFGAMTALRDLEVATEVTGYLMCTDNMPSGSALKLGDVLTVRGGTTVEVKNTDAEGRLVMSDALVLATELGVDAIVDIATLTGAALMALGPVRAAAFGNDQDLVDRVLAASVAADEPAWQLPLEPKYREQLDSEVADISNLGGKFAGATTAALFLAEFVGETPWAHLDIAGTMESQSDDSWRSKGATGYGARLLTRLLVDYPAG